MYSINGKGDINSKCIALTYWANEQIHSLKKVACVSGKFNFRQLGRSDCETNISLSGLSALIGNSFFHLRMLYDKQV